MTDAAVTKHRTGRLQPPPCVTGTLTDETDGTATMSGIVTESVTEVVSGTEAGGGDGAGAGSECHRSWDRR